MHNKVASHQLVVEIHSVHNIFCMREIHVREILVPLFKFILPHTRLFALSANFKSRINFSFPSFCNELWNETELPREMKIILKMISVWFINASSVECFAFATISKDMRKKLLMLSQWSSLRSFNNFTTFNLFSFQFSRKCRTTKVWCLLTWHAKRLGKLYFWFAFKLISTWHLIWYRRPDSGSWEETKLKSLLRVFHWRMFLSSIWSGRGKFALNILKFCFPELFIFSEMELSGETSKLENKLTMKNTSFDCK